MSAPPPLPFTTPDRPLTWLITGCSSGFGLSLLRLVQANGHNLIATSRYPSRTPELVAEVEKNGGKWLALDVDDKNSPALIDSLESSGTHIDVLVNNAGYAIFSVVESFADEELRAMMESLYFGPARLMRAVLPYMRKRRFGIVVNMSTGAALEGRDSMGGYSAAKAALDGMLLLARPFNIRTLIVFLGTFNTNMGNAALLSKNPLPDDYKGMPSEKLIEIMSSGQFDADGDKDKAMKAVYEVVLGEGVGKGLEAERYLPLGRDLAARMLQVRESYAHTMEVFGEVCNNVYRDGK
ncbi:hypothetical protein B0H63DRAFT_476940 [Podospora didyma]|uniref:Short-chain oxidoreductase n=1 Tax=Podospora didyma TaxID=330526 RepID=A0AAE0NI93_9PEZI|nr:hypothetical protein B0H63DRAFT_476940 [Podospora didyma]